MSRAIPSINQPHRTLIVPVAPFQNDVIRCNFHRKITQLVRIFLTDPAAKVPYYNRLHIHEIDSEGKNELPPLQSSIDVLCVGTEVPTFQGNQKLNHFFGVFENPPDLNMNGFKIRQIVVGNLPEGANSALIHNPAIFVKEPESWITNAFALLGKELSIPVNYRIQQPNPRRFEWIYKFACFIINMFHGG